MVVVVVVVFVVVVEKGQGVYVTGRITCHLHSDPTCFQTHDLAIVNPAS